MNHITVGSAAGQGVTVLEEKYDSDDSDCMIITAYSAPPRTAPMKCVPKSEPSDNATPVTQDSTETRKETETPPSVIPFTPLSASKPSTPIAEPQKASPIPPPVDPVTDSGVKSTSFCKFMRIVFIYVFSS